MAVLVTGGAGYIGSHTCVELLNAGEDIILLDNFSNAKPDTVRRIRELAGKDFPALAVDLLDREGVRRVFKEREIESVIHFAGLKAVGESVKIPLRYYENNLTGTVNLLSEMEERGCRRLVFSSSATVYGTGNAAPFKEDFPLSATNPYGWTKYMIEQIARDLCAANPCWSVCLLRYFNPIGAHPGGLLGEDPKGIPNNLLPYIAKVAAGALPELSVYGDDYPTPDGTGVRDYLHVCDLSRGHLDALRHVRENSGALAVNLGTGKGYSVLEVLAAFEKACGKKVPYKTVPRRPGDIATCYADPALAKNILGWEATRSLDEMCADTWNFIVSNQF